MKKYRLTVTLLFARIVYVTTCSSQRKAHSGAWRRHPDASSVEVVAL